MRREAIYILGSKRAVLVIAFRGGELHCCHADGYGGDIEALARRVAEIEAAFGKVSRCRLWYNLDATALTEAAIAQVAQSIARLQRNIVKISFVGVGKKKKAFHKKLEAALSGAAFPIAYFQDAEAAKEWLL